jgi:hypothetical protein
MLGMPKRIRRVYMLPTLHLLVSLFSVLGIIALRLPLLGDLWGLIMLIDLPISIVAYVVGWKYSWIAALWIIVVGTLWWYLLSRGVEFIFDMFKDRGTVVPPLIPRGDVDGPDRQNTGRPTR